MLFRSTITIVEEIEYEPPPRSISLFIFGLLDDYTYTDEGHETFSCGPEWTKFTYTHTFDTPESGIQYISARLDNNEDGAVVYWDNLSLVKEHTGDEFSAFFVKEISPSRKEVRLLLRDENNESVIYHFDQSGQPLSEEFTDQLQPSGTYQYDWTLNLNDQNIPITNYTFDPTQPPVYDNDTLISPAGENYGTLILRLAQPVPSSLTILDPVLLSQEIYTTQTQNIFYVSQVTGELGTVHGLSVDTDRKSVV